MANLINRAVLSLSGIKSVRSIEDNAIFQTYILIGMDYSWRHYKQNWSVNTAKKKLFGTISRRIFPGIPEINLEICGSDKTETVRLFNMLMWPTGNPGNCHGYIRHLRPETLRQFVTAEQL
jgi:hypothetical protein